MKRIALFFCFIFSFAAHANNIIVNGTRFIYPGNEKEITVQLSNNADRPALAQAWLDNGDADATPDTITTPFIITPPISRVDAKSGQTLRIKLGSSAGLAKDKETLARTCCSWRSVRALNLFIVLPDWATAMRRPRS